MRIIFIYNGAENLGIEYLSSLLRSKGHETFLLFDPAVFKGEVFINIEMLARICNVDDIIIKKAIKLKPDLIAFSVFTGNYRWCLSIAKSIKEKADIPIVFGGVHATAVPEKILKNDFIDFVIIGEGESAILDLLESLNSKEKLIKTSNICFKYKGKIHINPPRPYIRDLDSLPFPDKELFFKAVPSLRKNPYFIMTSRGCPYNCTYCSNNMYRNLYCNERNPIRRRSPDNVIREILINKKKFNIKKVGFVDDVFTSSVEWLEKFIEKYKSKINLPFYCCVHPLSINKKIAFLLKKGGCCFAVMGIQSGSEKIRKEIYKRFDSNYKIVKAISYLKKNGIKIQIDHIFGAPSETEDDLIKSMELYRKIKPDILLTFWLTYYPKCEIINIARKLDILSDKDIEKIEEGYIGYTHDIGSVPKEKIPLYKRYELLFELSSLVHNDKLYFILSSILQYFPFKKIISYFIYTITGLRYNKEYVFNKFYYAFENLILRNRLKSN